MAVMRTHISWTDSTWNPTVGCTKVSAGCDNCYAEAIVHRLMRGRFDEVKIHHDRLKQVHGFQPLRQGGKLKPRMVFVNSMSDIMHEQIPETFRHQVFDGMEDQPKTIFQVLTKRPMTLKKFIVDRYAKDDMAQNIWLGVSVEDNRVQGRINHLRQLKDQVGPFTAFLSVEPLIGPVDRHNYEGIDWVLIGGESMQNGRWRSCEAEWVMEAMNEAREHRAAIWFKQWGMWPNNPLYRSAPKGLGHVAKVKWCIEHGEKEARIVKDAGGRDKVAGEKGGATLLGQTYRELPKFFYTLRDQLNSA